MYTGYNHDRDLLLSQPTEGGGCLQKALQNILTMKAKRSSSRALKQTKNCKALQQVVFIVI